VPLLEHPHDYLGAYVAEGKARGWNPTGFYPTRRARPCCWPAGTSRNCSPSTFAWNVRPATASGWNCRWRTSRTPCSVAKNPDPFKTGPCERSKLRNCVICGQDCRECVPRLGGYCCEEHKQEMLARHRRLLDELDREGLHVMPVLLTETRPGRNPFGGGGRSQVASGQPLDQFLLDRGSGASHPAL
jgi:hypothetical protein